MRRVRRAAGWTLIALAAVAGGGALWARHELRASLPQLDGQLALPGLSAPVTVARDALGIPSITGGSREDAARATGFVHAQDRYFQMDLARRRAAGELAALVGARALAADREIRIHRFRQEAQRAVALMAPPQRRILDAYVSGVNAGLASLGAPPFEYLVLRQSPRPWRAEDSLLVVLAMFITLQEPDGAFESALGTMHDVLPAPVYDFLVPAGTSWDSPAVGAPLPAPALPGADVYNLRARRAGRTTRLRSANTREHAWPGDERGDGAIGSNNWVVSGALTESGAPLLANDMHLGIRVPNTWYRAMLDWRDTQGTAHRLVGVTLPGVPALVVGSNTHVAWGFTNTYADTSDIVMLDVDPARPGQYRTREGWKPFERFTERIEVAGGDAETLAVDWTIWGPVLPADYKGRARSYAWVAHSAERLAASITPLEGAETVADAFHDANTVGAPAQNLVVADAAGDIGWSVYGSLLRHEGHTGALPASWDKSDGVPHLLQPEEYPRVVNPDDGRLWTANNRVVDGAMLHALGDGNWEVGSRARIIRERLFAGTQFTPRDMLAIQLDTRAEFLERWRQVVIDALPPRATARSPARQAFRDVVERGWNGEASPDSAAYRLTRMFRDAVAERVFAFVLSECYEQDPAFDYFVLQRREGPLWALVSGKPLHLLDPAYASWDELFLAAIDGVIVRLEAEGAGDLRSRVWSQMNTAVYRHPLSGGLPVLGRWLDMPPQALPGDLYTPRMQWGANGPSERLVVSPGREQDGIMHMPTGQSGHPLSPFYANSHPAWAEGRPTPLLPGATAHTLTLVP